VQVPAHRARTDVEAFPSSAACPRCFSSTATDIISAPALHHARRTTKTYTGIITRAKGCKAGAEYLTVSQPRQSSAVHLALWQRSCQLSAVYHYGRLDFGIVANSSVGNRSKVEWALLIGDDTGP